MQHGTMNTKATPTVGDRARAVRVAWTLIRRGVLDAPGKGERLHAEWAHAESDCATLAIRVVVQVDGRTERELALVAYEAAYFGDVWDAEDRQGSRERLARWLWAGPISGIFIRAPGA